MRASCCGDSLRSELPVGVIHTSSPSRTLMLPVDPKAYPRAYRLAAISQRSFDGRRGVVTVGAASEGHPDQVRFTDGYGNLHFVMAEPLEPDAVIPEGAEVAILRTRSGEPRILKID